MKIAKVRIQNFRSIVDSGVVTIEEKVTVLVGKNEQGKTTFLKALESFNTDKKYSRRDLPIHLIPSLEVQSAEDIPVTSIWFSIEPKERASLESVIGPSASVAHIRSIKYHGNNYRHYICHEKGSEKEIHLSKAITSKIEEKVRDTFEALLVKLRHHQERVPKFAPSSEQTTRALSEIRQANLSDVQQIDNIIGTLFTSLKSMPGQDEAISEDIATYQQEVDKHVQQLHDESKRDVTQDLTSKYPIFIFHSSGPDQVPNDVQVDEFVSDPEGTSQGMLNLCRAAGLTVQKIQELASSDDRSFIQPFEDYHTGKISGGLNEFWEQQEYVVHFNIQKSRLSVSISDHTYSRRVQPSDRSDGFRWYLSFYCRLLTDVTSTNPKCILLDNPAVDLHVDGQRDIKRFLEEKLALDCQIMYVTHSPAMIDPYNLVQVRKVELKADNVGTKISGSLNKVGSDIDLLEPVRLAIGASLVSSLLFDELNVLIEGAADKPILDAAFELFKAETPHKILVNGSISETKDGFLPKFYKRAGLPFVILLDGDSGGRDLKKRIGRNWL